MARIYGGIFGLVAMLTMLAKGGLSQSDLTSTVLAACCGLWIYMPVGCLLGWIAGRIVEESVRARFVSEMTTGEKGDSPSPEKTSG